jgi:hypothetical protein
MLRNAPEAFFIGASVPGKGNEAASLDEAWKNAWRHGWKLDLESLFPGRPGPVGLPSYPWNREKCWRGDSPECRGYLREERVHPLLGWQLPGKAPVFENTLHLADFSWLTDHLIGDRIFYPAAAFLESMLAAARLLSPEQGAALERVVLLRPLRLAPDAPQVLRLSADREDGGVTVEARSWRSAEDWGLYARGRMVPAVVAPGDRGFAVGSPENFGRETDKESLYAAAERFRFRYGPVFRIAERAWTSPDRSEALADLGSPADFPGMHVPPPALDGAFHLMLLLLGENSGYAGRVLLPAFFERVTLVADGRPRFAHARLEKIGPRSVVASFRLLDAEGKTLLLLRGCRFRSASLERESVPSGPHEQAFFPVPHPEDLRMPGGISPGLLAEAAKGPFPQNSGRNFGRDAAGEHPWLLLQLASLAAARETVLATGIRPGQNFSCDDLLASGALHPSQELWFRRLLERLEKASLAEREGEVRRVLPAPGEHRDAATLWRTALAVSPGHLGEAALLSRVAAAGGGLLRGEPAEEGVPLHDAAYLDNALSLKPAADAAVRALRTALGALRPGEGLRILQFSPQPLSSFITPLAPLLETVPCRYTVALEDEAAVEAAAARFSRVPAARFTALSPETPEPPLNERCHILLLAWSLHRSLNVASALDRCRSLLAPGGLLLLLEQRPGPFADYVFGSRPSWWQASPGREKPVSLFQEASFWEKPRCFPAWPPPGAPFSGQSRRNNAFRC